MIQQPIPEVVNAVFSILEQHKIYIPRDHIDMTIACMSSWLENTKRGHEYMAHLLQMNAQRGSHAKQYFLKDGFGRLTDELEPENIVFLSGCTYKGEAIPLSLVQVNDREYMYCDCCGSRIICGQDVESREGKHLTCSSCLAQSGEQDLRDMVKLNCSSCNFTRCSWNPQHKDAEVG
jgi:hypothetical protein